MAFTFSNVTGLDHGILLDIVFTKGVRDQLNADFAEFDLVQTIRNKEATPRALVYKAMAHRGPSRVQFMNPGDASEAMPSGQKVGISEFTAYFKSLSATTQVDSDLIHRLNATQAKAMDELALELDETTLNYKKQIAGKFYADGTGLVVRSQSAVVTSGTGAGTDKIVITAADMGETVDSLAAGGSITFLEYGDILLPASKGGVACDPTLGATAVGYKVEDIDIDAGTATLKPVNSSFAAVAITSDGGSVPVGAAGVCWYRLEQSGAFPVLSSPIADFGTASRSFVGLESLGAIDGRVVNGITMSGVYKGTRKDCGGALIDIDHIQSAFSIAKRRIGQSAASYKQAMMHDKVWDVFVASKEGDRRFVNVTDNARGSQKFVYIHGNDTIEFVVSQYCPINRIWSLPSSAKGGKVVEMHMTDLISEKAPDGGSPWHRVVNTNGRPVKQFESFSTAFCQMIARLPSAIVSLSNFTIS